MRLLLPLLLLSIAVVHPAEARQQRGTESLLFCYDEDNLSAYEMTKTTKELREIHMPGCMVLRSGTRYVVLDNPLSRTRHGALRVRIRQGRKTVEGFLVRIGRSDRN